LHIFQIYDQLLTYVVHNEKTMLKVNTRNGLLRKQVDLAWGDEPNTVRTTVLSLWLSAGEYASAVWCHSVHANKLDIALNKTRRIITCCLMNTAIEKLYILSGIAPPHIRRAV